MRYSKISDWKFEIYDDKDIDNHDFFIGIIIYDGLTWVFSPKINNSNNFRARQYLTHIQLLDIANTVKKLNLNG